jgi:DNA-binding NarL/FixJ family response regulator
MLLLSVRPAIAAALASQLQHLRGSVEVRRPSGAAGAGRHDVVILDAARVTRAFERLAQLAETFSDARLIVLVSHPSDLAARLARQAGAHAVLSESDPLDTWADILSRLPGATFLMGDSFRGAPAICPRLTERQLEVYMLTALGASDEEIGARLGMATATAETHRRDAQLRLGCAGIRELVAHALRHGLVDATDVELRPTMRQATRSHSRETNLV